MPLTIAVGDVFRMRTFAMYFSQLGINTWHFRVTASNGGACTAIQFITGTEAPTAAAYKAAMTNGALYYGTGAARIFPSVTPEEYTALSQGPGTAGNNPMPTALSMLVQKITATVGVGGRGRCYIPFPDNAFVTAPDPEINLAGRALGLAIGSAATALIIGRAQGTAVFNAEPILYHHALPGASHAITNTACGRRWGTQHRRGDFGRLNRPPF